MNKLQFTRTIFFAALTVTPFATAHAQDAPPADDQKPQVTVVAPAGSVTKVVTKANGAIVVTVNGKPAEFAPTSLPLMLEGHVMVPLRGVIEKLGGTVLYDAKSKIVSGAHEKSGNQFRMRVGSDEALLNGQKMPLDAPPRVVNGVTYVPLRFVSQAMGAKVEWDAIKRTVIIEGEDGTAKVQTDK